MIPAAQEIWRWIARGLDVLLVAAIIYSLIMLARGTRAWKIFSGLAVFAVVYLLSAVLEFQTLNWLLRQIVPLAPVALVILFYPELRFALEEMGRVQFWRNRMLRLPEETVHQLIEQLTRAATQMSGRSIGALVVLEREEGLDDLIATGTPIDAHVTAELLGTLFHPGSPLHDGAVILRGDRVVAGGCLLPLTERPNVGSEVHTRHRAAIGVTERSDALVVVVSEETGTISLGAGGNLIRGLKSDSLRQHLRQILVPPRERPTRAPIAIPRWPRRS